MKKSKKKRVGKKSINKQYTFNLKNQYKESFDFIRESRKFIYIIIAIFLLFTILGFVFPVPGVILKVILEFIENLIKETNGLSGFEMIKFIFFNNIQSSFFGMILGIFLGFLPVLFAAVNGYVLGFVLSMSVMSEGISVLWRLLPHGIFELPAIFISLGLGLRLGMFIFQKKVEKSLKEYLWGSIKVFLLIVLPLLIIAAIVEGSLIVIFG